MPKQARSTKAIPVWDLSSLKPKNVEFALRAIDARARKIETRRGRLDRIPVAEFISLISELEVLKRDTSHLMGYAHLWLSEDSSNENAQALTSTLQQSFVKVENRLLFITLWFKELSDERAASFIAGSGPFRYYLEQIRKARPYTLSEKEERVINVLDATGSSALPSIYSTITTQLAFTYRKKQVDQHALLVLVRDKDPRVRKDAYLSLLSRYAREKDVLGQIYRDIVLSWREENITLRGYVSSLHVRNVMNDVPDDAVEALLSSCAAHERLFHRFFAVKRKRLGLPVMRRFDLYAPVEEKERKIPYDRALKTVLDAFEAFSPVFRKDAELIIKEGHVHARIQKNKNPGAFCAGISTRVMPYVLLNYAGTSRDVSTIAHELGHGVHFLLAQEQTEFTHDACLPLAETASIFGEMLLMERLRSLDPEQAHSLLFLKLEDIYASIIRQAGFVSFERKAHDLFSQGKTIQDVSAVYLADLRKQLGPRIEVDDDFKYEWLYIPHIFHSPFYCYAYAFGNLLVLALWDRYLREGKPFVPRMIGLLKKGGSESPAAITRAVGIDIRSRKFWDGGFAVIDRMVSTLEKASSR